MPKQRINFINYNGCRIGVMAKGFRWNSYIYKTMQDAVEAIDKAKAEYIPSDPYSADVHGNRMIQARKRNNDPK